MIDQLDAYLSATQLGITLASIGLGIVGEPAVNRLLQPLFDLLPNLPEEAAHSISLMVAFAIISMFHIVLGELAPKSLAIRRPEPTSLWVAAPAVVLLPGDLPRHLGAEQAGERLPAPVRDRTAPARPSSLTARRRSAVSSPPSRRRNSPSPSGSCSTTCSSSPTATRARSWSPRTEVVYLDRPPRQWTRTSTAPARAATRASPLCEGDLDQLVGLVHIKDLFIAEEPPESLRNIARETFAVPETPAAGPVDGPHAPRAHPHGGGGRRVRRGGAGIVTLENVLEEIVGEIQDEFDAEAPEFVRLDDGGYRVLGGMLLDDLEDELGMDISDAPRGGHRRGDRAVRARAHGRGGRQGRSRSAAAGGDGGGREPDRVVAAVGAAGARGGGELGACAVERRAASSAAKGPGEVGAGAKHGVCDGFGGSRSLRRRTPRSKFCGERSW